MSSDNISIRVRDLGKCYEIYESPRDRLKQFLLPRLRKAAGFKDKAYFKEFWAVDGISFTVERGKTLGIIGRNGSGKSTLLQMICGTLTPTSGNIQTQGRIAALLELGSGFNPEFTGRENVYLNASVLGLTDTQIRDRFDDIAEFADIGEFIEQPVKTYSSGMLVRLAFSVIAHVDADVLVVDEALAVGDTFFTQKCMRFFRKFMEKGTLLFVSHDTGSIKSLCDRVVWLERGKLVKEGDPKEVCELYLEAFYEVIQGKSTSTKIKPSAEVMPNAPLIDQRMALINGSNLRNDLRIFEFDSDAAGFGKAGAEIYHVAMLDTSEKPLAWLVGGEQIILRVKIKCHVWLQSPIVGFYVKDRLGQTLFGDNTYILYRESPVVCEAGQGLQVDFCFQMPILPAGDYSVAVAIANGTQDVHEQHHWIHDAIIFRSESSSVSTGLVGIPMRAINMVQVEDLE